MKDKSIFKNQEVPVYEHDHKPEDYGIGPDPHQQDAEYWENYYQEIPEEYQLSEQEYEELALLTQQTVDAEASVEEDEPVKRLGMLEYPHGKTYRITFEYDYRDVDKLLAYSKSKFWEKALLKLAHAYPAWKTDFNFEKGEYKFKFYNGRTEIREYGGFPSCVCNHEDDLEFALYLLAEILYWKGVSRVEVISASDEGRIRMKRELKGFGIQFRNVQLFKPD